MATTKQLSKHTPGPWTTQRLSPYDTLGDYKVAIRDRRNIYLGELTDFDSAISHDDIDANARLIVKAPEMYELLSKMAQWAENPSYPLHQASWCDKARRIKAEIDEE